MTYVVNLLVSNGTIVLQDVVVDGSSRVNKLLDSRLETEIRVSRLYCHM